MIKDRVGQSVYGTNTHHLQKTLHDLKKGKQVAFDFQFDANLGAGTYSLAVALHASDTHIGKNYEWRDHAIVFSVINTKHDQFLGVAWLPPKVEIQ